MSKNHHEEDLEPEENDSVVDDCELDSTPPSEPEMVSMTKDEWDEVCHKLARLNTDYYELEKDFDNFRERSKEAISQSRIDGLKDALCCILPALDSLNKAKKMVDEVSLEGINLIEKSIMSALDKLKVEKIDCIGEKFDPSMHNAVFMQEKKGVKPGIVIDELESGYTYDGKVLKYSAVVVSK